MIVNYTENGWDIITQRAHGLLAGQLAMHWKVSRRPKRWTETILAIAGHDDEETELQETDLLTAQGGPVNFSMTHFDEARARRLIDFSLSRSRYTALLAAKHLEFLYHKESETNAKAKAFLSRHAHLQKQWCSELKIEKQEADSIYGLLEWCDAFSLLLCQNKVQPEQRMIEISNSSKDDHPVLTQNNDGSLNVAPWPFEEDGFEIHVETRLLRQLQFKNATAFKKAFLAAEVKEKTWIIRSAK